MENQMLRVLLLLVLLSNLGCKSQLIAQTGNNEPFSMGEGIVVDPGSGQLFIMTPVRKVSAVAIATGATLWTSVRNAKPMAIAGNRLVCQMESTASPQNVILGRFNISGNGSLMATDSITLPTGIRANLGQTATDQFRLKTKVVGNLTYFGWSYQQKMLKGIREMDSLLQNSGAFQYNVNSRQLNPIAQQNLPVSFSETIVPISDKKIQNKEDGSQQFLSSDKQHVLISRKTTTDDTLNNYVWEIYNSSSKQKIGEISTYRSYAPFFVMGSTLIYEEGPYSNRTGGKMNEVPRQLVAVNLQTGAILWKNEVLDSVYRGPTPP